MNTLIELYDERAIENVLAPEVFRPERVVFLTPTEIMQDKTARDKLAAFFVHRGWMPEVLFLESSLYKADRILKQMRMIAEQYSDCAVDVTGGTDAALFAAGQLSAETGIPAFTYSRKKNSFYNISNAPFADELPCSVSFPVEDFFLMAGGTMRKGRVDNSRLSAYMPKFDPFFDVFLRFRRQWGDIVTYIQRISPVEKGLVPPMHVTGSYVVKGEHGGTVKANAAALHAFEEIGFLSKLEIREGEGVSFSFRDEMTRAWLRDVGSVLELYAYKACIDTGIFNDVVSSAVVDWDGTQGHDSVSNEIDVMASRGVIPLFLSCKTCEIKTEAINELAVLRDRFGGKGAKGALVTAEPCNAAARHRAAQLNLAVIDLEELEADQLAQRIKIIMKA